MKNKEIKICISIWSIIIIFFIFIRFVSGISDGETIAENIKANSKDTGKKDQIAGNFNEEQKNQVEKETENLKEQTVIVIDPGHGGDDCGATACDRKTYEKDLNLSIALELKKILESNHIDVIMTRESDKHVTLEERANIVNTARPKLVLSIHCNSFKGNASGLTVYYNENQSNQTFDSKQFSTIISEEIKKVVPYKNRGVVKGSHLYIVRNTESIVALAEIGFISYKKDFNFINEKTNQKIIAKSLYDGIIKSLPYTEGNKSE